MPMSDGERIEVLGMIKKAEGAFHVSKIKLGGDSDLIEHLRHILNIVKRLVGDKSPLVE